LLLNNGNPARAQIAQILQDEAKKVGIKITIVPKDLKVVTKLQREHTFEMAFNGWVLSPEPFDPKQTWATSSYNNGRQFHRFRRCHYR